MNNYPVTKNKSITHGRSDRKQIKRLAESSPFHLFTNPHVINRLIFGHGVVIYYIQSIFRRKKLVSTFDKAHVFFSQSIDLPVPSC